MLLFVGDKSVGYWVEEPARINQQTVEYIPTALNIKEQTNDILRIRKEKVNFVVYDLEQYSINATEIADEIWNISKAGNVEPIFLATSFMPSSELVIKLQQRGFKKFIFAYNDSERKSELEKCMNGYYDTTTPEQLLDIPEEAEVLEKKHRVLIGVGGACNRIGTTTHAMQLVKHLLYCGEKACYIEVNSTGFVDALAEAYTPDEIDEEKGRVTFSNVDMYYRQDLIPEVLHMDYEYFVYDYGSFSDNQFNKISFLEKEIKIMVLGSNPGEIQLSTALISNVFYQDIHYLFNFTSPSDQEDLSSMMGEKQGRTYFASYCPDMFHYVPADYYTLLFPQIAPHQEETKRNRKWWKRG